MMSRAAAIWSLLRNISSASSVGVPEINAILVSLSRKISFTKFWNLKRVRPSTSARAGFQCSFAKRAAMISICWL